MLYFSTVPIYFRFLIHKHSCIFMISLAIITQQGKFFEENMYITQVLKACTHAHSSAGYYFATFWVFIFITQTAALRLQI